MNEEMIKAMNRKEQKHSFRKWWSKNGYKVLRVILFPIWIFGLLQEKITKWLNGRQSWNEQRATEILNYYIPRKAEWCAEEKTFYFFDNGYGWNMHLAKRHLKRKDRRFFEVNKIQIRRFLIDTFNLENCIKEIGDCSNGWTEIDFKLQ